MKMSHTIALVFALVFTSASATFAQSEHSAKVVRMHGAARYSTGKGSWQTLTSGMILKPGTLIQTAQESSVDLVLGYVDNSNDGQAPTTTPVIHQFTPVVADKGAVRENIIRLEENTVLSIDKLYFEQTGAGTVSETLLDLRAGRLLGNVKKLSSASKFEIKLPNGVAGIRGTVFVLDATTGNCAVISGAVVVTYFANADDATPVTVNVPAWSNLYFTKNPEGKLIQLTPDQYHQAQYDSLVADADSGIVYPPLVELISSDDEKRVSAVLGTGGFSK